MTRGEEVILVLDKYFDVSEKENEWEIMNGLSILYYPKYDNSKIYFKISFHMLTTSVSSFLTL